MKLAIISDIHDNLANLDKILGWCRDKAIDEIICCGDVTNKETIKAMSTGFSGPIHLVRGNMEIFADEAVKPFENIKYYGETARAELGGKTVGICHEPQKIDRILAEGPCDIIFYGHTHKPWEENKNGVRTVNPGNVAGVLHKATFASWDTKTDNLGLKILDDM